MYKTIIERIAALRHLMKEDKIDAFIIPTADPHISEYPAACWKDREWISGFTGSSGTVVITADKAGLWTDSRYFLQADEQLKNSGIDLYKMRTAGFPTIAEFLLDVLKNGQTVGLNGLTYSIADAKSLAQALSSKGIKLDSDKYLIDRLWTERPALPDGMAFEMPTELSGKDTVEKLTEIKEALHKANADCTVLSSLDEVAWTFNFRGTDVLYNPVVVSYAFISDKETVLFVNPKKLPVELSDRLTKDGVIIADYAMLTAYLKRLAAGTRVFLDCNRTNVAIGNAVKHCTIIDGISPANHLKSVKNETEINGFHNAVLKDGIALTKFFFWLEKSMANGDKVTELSASDKLTTFRAAQPLYIMNSFETISSYGAHGAIVHYEPTPETDVELKPDNLYLNDSGGQYLDGTTDITRTIALCTNPTAQMKDDYTRVLKGTIDLAKCKFPAGARGCMVDAFARKALWEGGINFTHGTGHGIGHCLNVHEGPQSIRMEENPTILKEGMVISDEPALYRTGQYGIRTENMILVKKDCETEWGQFLTFETLTLCYIDTKLIDMSLMSPDELRWLNSYHQMVYNKLSPHLNEEERAWLKDKTKEI